MNDKQSRRPQPPAQQRGQHPAPRQTDQAALEKAGKTRYAEALARVARDLESDSNVLAGLLMASTDSSEFGQFINEVQLVIVKAYKKDGSNPLLEASSSSFRLAVREAAGFGYSLNPRMGECFLIPRKGQVEMQAGYKGLNKLAWRSGILSALHAECVYKGEPYKRIGGTDRPRIEHEPDDTGSKRTNKWDDILCAYATAFVGDSKHAVFQVAPRWRLALARGSASTDAWKNNPDAMCRKTALIMLAPELPRHDKLRDFHLAVERELELERQNPEYIVSMDDGSEDAGREWLRAVEGYGSIGITEDQLVTYLGIESSASVTGEQLIELEDLFKRARSGDQAAAEEFEKMRSGSRAVEAAPIHEADGQPDGQPATME